MQPTHGTFVVTGVTSGIGLTLAHALAGIAGTLVMVARDEGRLRDVADSVKNRGPRDLDLIPVVANLSEMRECRSLAERLVRLPRIDVLLHNAGLLPARLKLTRDGFEESFATNHLAPFLLNALLRPLLVASAPARIVQVSAGLALGAKIHLEGDPRGIEFDPMSSYATTKRWNLLATLEWADELRGAGVTVNAVHPGVVRTQLGVGAPGIPGPEARRTWLSPEAGAQGPLRLATAPELSSTTGRYFNQTQEMPLHRPMALQKDVVRRTAALLNLPS